MDIDSYIRICIENFEKQQENMMRSFKQELITQLKTWNNHYNDHQYRQNEEIFIDANDNEMEIKRRPRHHQQQQKGSNSNGGENYCGFCRKNGEMPIVYKNHRTKSSDGQQTVLCPILQRHICEICGATGEKAHTKKYCPMNTRDTSSSSPKPAFRLLANGRMTFNHYHK